MKKKNETSYGSDICPSGESVKNVEAIANLSNGFSDQLFNLLYVARIAATDTYRTSERADTRFRRSFDEAIVALKVFKEKIMEVRNV